MTTDAETRERIERIARQIDDSFKGTGHTPYGIAKAAMSAFAEESKWQPISSAPKDGTEILVYQGTLVYHAKWGGERHPTWVYPKTGISFVDSSTHWQPLPEPPIEKDEV